jgi:hypothetical protein
MLLVIKKLTKKEGIENDVCIIKLIINAGKKRLTLMRRREMQFPG